MHYTYSQKEHTNVRCGIDYTKPWTEEDAIDTRFTYALLDYREDHPEFVEIEEKYKKDKSDKNEEALNDALRDFIDEWTNPDYTYEGMFYNDDLYALGSALQAEKGYTIADCDYLKGVPAEKFEPVWFAETLNFYAINDMDHLYNQAEKYGPDIKRINDEAYEQLKADKERD